MLLLYKTYRAMNCNTGAWGLGPEHQAVLFWELFLILGICSQLNILKVPDLNRVEYVGFSRDQLAIARIFVGLASYWTRS